MDAALTLVHESARAAGVACAVAGALSGKLLDRLGRVGANALAEAPQAAAPCMAPSPRAATPHVHGSKASAFEFETTGFHPARDTSAAPALAPLALIAAATRMPQPSDGREARDEPGAAAAAARTPPSSTSSSPAAHAPCAACGASSLCASPAEERGSPAPPPPALRLPALPTTAGASQPARAPAPTRRLTQRSRMRRALGAAAFTCAVLAIGSGWGLLLPTSTAGSVGGGAAELGGALAELVGDMGEIVGATFFHGANGGRCAFDVSLDLPPPTACPPAARQVGAPPASADRPPLQVHTSVREVDQLLAPNMPLLGADFDAYRRHVYRVLTYAVHFWLADERASAGGARAARPSAPCARFGRMRWLVRAAPARADELQHAALIAGVVFHDLGSWAPPPSPLLSSRAIEASVAHAHAALSHWARERLDLVAAIIRNQHKLTPFTGAHAEVVNAVRKAEWLESTAGALRFGVSRRDIARVNARLPRGAPAGGSGGARRGGWRGAASALRALFERRLDAPKGPQAY
ncbi:hypothetical protein KFE25_013103 [Diacronema lutheri]|uniref:Uncharacterized protein n=1 Tax=Diacronema lutheri TaxID=2081491 RepID=A0A8J5XBE8_DIALT|nr:hypothetical protein KFE25_013103 [Diacronema lutheri]